MIISREMLRWWLVVGGVNDLADKINGGTMKIGIWQFACLIGQMLVPMQLCFKHILTVAVRSNLQSQ